jgi:hypothetical protein
MVTESRRAMRAWRLSALSTPGLRTLCIDLWAETQLARPGGHPEKVSVRCLGLDAADEAKIFGGNARRSLGLAQGVAALDGPPVRGRSGPPVPIGVGPPIPGEAGHLSTATGGSPDSVGRVRGGASGGCPCSGWRTPYATLRPNSRWRRDLRSGMSVLGS